MTTMILILAEGGFLVFLLALSIFIIKKANRAKASQDKIIQSIRQGTSTDWCRINIARPSYFNKKMKVLGFESRGILVNYKDSIRIIGQFPSGKWLDKRYSKDSLDLQWVGNKVLSSSNMHWISVNHLGENDGKKWMVSADTGFNALQSREATADICRRINVDFPLPDVATSEVALEKNPASMKLVILFFTTIAFAAIDGVFLNKNQLLNYEIIGNKIFLVLLLSIPSYLFLTKAKIPSRESLVLSMLVAAGFLVAYIPAIQRIDQIGAEPQSIAYRLETNAVLMPVTPGSPQLVFSKAQTYWSQFKIGSIHYFPMTHGWLGLWQLDSANLNEEMRQFYEKQNEKGNKTGGQDGK